MPINLQPGKSEPAPHKPGDVFGRFTVLNYVTRSAQHPTTGKWLSKPLNWYVVRCECGTEEVVNQPMLAPSGRRQCLECCAEQKARSISTTRRQAVVKTSVPDFARMKF